MKRPVFAANLWMSIILCACVRSAPDVASSSEPAAASSEQSAQPTGSLGASSLNRIGRGEFNQRSSELALPFFWTYDANQVGTLEPSELTVLWGLKPEPRLGDWVGPSGFTPA